MILIVTHSADLTADLVIRHLSRLQASYLRLDTDALGTPACHAGFDDAGPWLAANSKRWRPTDFRAVWHRRFALPRVLEAVEVSVRTFVQRELSIVLDAFLASIVGLHMNPAEADVKAGNRLLQAMAAQRVGLDTPSTLVTQSDADTRDFFLRHHRVVTKAASFGRLSDAERIVFTTEIPKDGDLSGIEVCPSLFQERIPAVREWRITIVGCRVFAARTQDRASYDVDWRRDPDHYRLFEKATLPHGVEFALLDLMRRGGLHFGAHDLIETVDGRFVFLETNPAGQWGWLELSLGLPIGETIAGHLLGAKHAQVPDSTPPSR